MLIAYSFDKGVDSVVKQVNIGVIMQLVRLFNSVNHYGQPPNMI